MFTRPAIELSEDCLEYDEPFDPSLVASREEVLAHDLAKMRAIKTSRVVFEKSTSPDEASMKEQLSPEEHGDLQFSAHFEWCVP